MHRIWMGVAISVAGFITLAPRVCTATAPTEAKLDEAPSSTAGRRWYGWQTFTADGVAGAMFLGAIADDYNSTLFGLSGLSFGLGAPATHAAHGRWGVALGSLGMRILGPFIGAAVGAAGDIRYQDDAGGGSTSGKWTAVGAGIGGLVVSALDGALLAYDAESPRPPRNQLLMANSLPQVVVLRHGIGLGYSGQF